jgi:hypothetical protein
MQVLKQRSPGWVVVEDGVHKCDQAAAALGEDRLTPEVGLPEAISPHGHAVRDDVTVKEGVGIRASVVSAPAVGVKRGDGLCVRATGKRNRRSSRCANRGLLHRSITNLRPATDSITRNRKPHIRAQVTDAETNLRKVHLTLFVDGVRIARTQFAYNLDTDRLRYKPKSGLSFGRHTVRVVARDPGGLVSRKVWSFRVAGS